jgi:hypothetical protein
MWHSRSRNYARQNRYRRSKTAPSTAYGVRRFFEVVSLRVADVESKRMQREC